MDAAEYIVENLRHPSAENQRRTLAGIAGRTCEGCGACCGRILPMTIRERARLLDYARRHGVEPHADASNMCSMLDPEQPLPLEYGPDDGGDDDHALPAFTEVI